MRLALAILGATLVAAPSAIAAQPPTAVGIERATERFLDRDRPPAPARAPVAAPWTALPEQRVVALYGAPQMGRTILGLKSPRGAAAKLATQSAPYGALGDRPVSGEFDLVSVFATAGGGPDGLYRTRQDDQVIQIYLDQARAIGARLMLDIQPGRATFLGELRALREWVIQPDVDIALDPEWNVGRRGIPGRTQGRVGAKALNAVSAKLAATVETAGLPPKLLVVHQFRNASIRGRGRVKRRAGVQTVLNFDGIGSPAAKQDGYAELSSPRLFSGFSVFYRLDDPLMAPPAVLGLVPEPDFLLYQ